MAAPAHVAGWERYTGRPWPRQSMGPGSSHTLGVPFCPDEFGPGARLLVQIAFGAVLGNPSSSWPWTDVTTDVQQANGQFINISVIGRPDESIVTPPAACSFQLDNRQNLYSKNNPLCPNWPNIKSNVPMRVMVTFDGGAHWYAFFWGEMTTWKPGWDTTGGYAVVNVQAYGRSRRADQGTVALQSAIYRAIAGYVPSPTLYFPMDDGVGSTSAWSAISGQKPYPFSGTVSFDSTNSPAGGNGSADITNLLTSAKAYQPRSPLMIGGAIGSSFAVAFWIKITPSSGTWAAPLMNFITPGSTTTASWFLRANNTQHFLVSALNGSGGEIEGVQLDNGTANLGDGNWHFCWFSLVKISSTVARVNGGVDTLTGGFFNLGSTQDVEPVAGISIGATSFLPAPTNVSQVNISNVAIFENVVALDFYNPGVGWVGETPQARMVRLCAENGIEFQTVGFYDTDTAMGVQGVDTFMNLLRECELADAGFLYDGFGAGLTYQGISQRYDQRTALTLDVAAHEIRGTIDPVDDDQRTVNKITVNRKNGSSATAEDTTGPLGTGTNGIGVVGPSQLTINTQDDSRLGFRAGWEVASGTIEGFRYPLLSLNMRAKPAIAQKWMNRADGFSGPVVPGCRLDITNIETWATQHPSGTLSLMIEGWSMRLTNLMWETDLVLTNNRKYDVFKVGDVQLGRLQTDGSTMAVDAPVGSTTLLVTTKADSNTWTTVAGDFPMYVEIDGIKVKVTAISGFTSTQTFTVDGSTVTKPLLVGKSVKVWHSGRIKY